MILLNAKKNNDLFESGCLYRISSRIRYAALLTALTLTGCFGPSGLTPVDIPLESEISSLSLIKLESDPLLYRVTHPAIEFPLFATAFEACGVKNFVPSKAMTRQLLVGFSNMTVNGQETIATPKGTVLQTDTSATVDDEPITLITFTKRGEECVRDFAFWYRTSQASEDSAAVIKKVLRSNFVTDRAPQ